jgi:tetratricopeptide (TPR) repeat protein
MLPELGPSAAQIAELLPELGAALPEALPTLSPEHARFLLFDGVTRLLTRVSSAQFLLLVFDDLHAAEAPSLLLLQFLARHIPDARILVLGTYRDAEATLDPAVGELLAGILHEGDHIPLRGLTEVDVGRLVHGVSGRPGAPRFVRDVHRKTEGNPFFVDEIVHLLAAEGRLDSSELQPDALGVPDAVRQTISRRLGALSEPTRRVVSAASVVGRDFDLEVLALLDIGSPAELRASLQEAIARAIVVETDRLGGGYAFGHALFRETLYEELEPASRSDLHRRIADALEELHRLNPEPVLAALARHRFEAALGGGDVDEAVDYADRAGRRAKTLLAFEEAADCYERALRALELRRGRDDRRRCDCLLGLGDARWRAGDMPRAKQAYLQAAEISRAVGAAQSFARAALGYATGGFAQTTVYQLDELVVRLLEEAVDRVGDADRALRARCLARLANELYTTDQVERREALSREAVETARALGDPGLLLFTLYCRGVAILGPDRTAERLAISEEIPRLAAAVGDSDMAFWGQQFRLRTAIEMGDMAAVDAAIEACGRAADTLRVPLYRYLTSLYRTMKALAAGRLAEAEHFALQTRALGQGVQTLEVEEAFTIHFFFVRWLQGRLRDLEPVFVSVGERNRSSIVRTGFCFAYGEFGRVEEARAVIETLSAREFACVPRDGNWLSALFFLALGCASLGEPRHAPVLYRLLSPHVESYVTPAAGSLNFGSMALALALLAAEMGHLEEAFRHFESALERNICIANHPFTAMTLREYARCVLDRGEPGDRERSLGLLERASALIDSLGLAGLRDRTLALRLRAQRAGNGAEVAASGDNAFRREGEYWTIAYGGEVVRLRGAKGLGDIAFLLASPGREVHVADLIAVSEGIAIDARAESYAAMSAEQLAESGLAASAGSSVDSGVDPRARAEYRARLADLHQELEDAERSNDVGRASRVRAELDFIAGELVSAYGLGGRARKGGDPVERARKTVGFRIRDAITKIERVHPALARHLRNSIRTGTFCGYEPEAVTSWSSTPGPARTARASRQ